MFKSGEVAKIRSDGRQVTILPIEVSRVAEHRWPIKTSEGLFDETELSPAHPTVLTTAEARDPAEARSVKKDRMTPEAQAELLRSLKLRDEVEGVLKEAAFDANGHWKNGSFCEGYKPLEHMHLFPGAVLPAEAEDLIRAARDKKPLDRWVQVTGPFGMSGMRTCPYCGADNFAPETNGLVVRLSGEPCEFPNGLPPTEWELNVPSGKIVVANDLRRIFPLPEDEEFDINTTLGCRQTALAYAANGMALTGLQGFSWKAPAWDDYFCIVFGTCVAGYFAFRYTKDRLAAPKIERAKAIISYLLKS